MKKKNLYSGFFYRDPLTGENRHTTWEFGFDCELPEGVSEGDEVELEIVGGYEDDDISCLIVHLWIGERVFTHQPSEMILHVTMRTSNGISPVQSGIRAMKNGWKTIEVGRQRIQARADFFEISA